MLNTMMTEFYHNSSIQMRLEKKSAENVVFENVKVLHHDTFLNPV